MVNLTFNLIELGLNLILDLSDSNGFVACGFSLVDQSSNRLTIILVEGVKKFLLACVEFTGSSCTIVFGSIVVKITIRLSFAFLWFSLVDQVDSIYKCLRTGCAFLDSIFLSLSSNSVFPRIYVSSISALIEFDKICLRIYITLLAGNSSHSIREVFFLALSNCQCVVQSLLSVCNCLFAAFLSFAISGASCCSVNGHILIENNLSPRLVFGNPNRLLVLVHNWLAILINLLLTFDRSCEVRDSTSDSSVVAESGLCSCLIGIDVARNLSSFCRNCWSVSFSYLLICSCYRIVLSVAGAEVRDSLFNLVCREVVSSHELAILRLHLSNFCLGARLRISEFLLRCVDGFARTLVCIVLCEVSVGSSLRGSVALISIGQCGNIEWNNFAIVFEVSLVGSIQLVLDSLNLTLEGVHLTCEVRSNLLLVLINILVCSSFLIIVEAGSEGVKLILSSFIDATE